MVQVPTPLIPVSIRNLYIIPGNVRLTIPAGFPYIYPDTFFFSSTNPVPPKTESAQGEELVGRQ